MTIKTKHPARGGKTSAVLTEMIRYIVENRDRRVGELENQLRNLEKAHIELQKFYAQSQDELHACRERELMRPWWKKLLGIR